MLASLVGAVQSALKQRFGVTVEQADIAFQAAPQGRGDIALPCGALAKKLEINPAKIAAALAGPLDEHDAVALARAEGPYLNMHFHGAALFAAACRPLEERLIRPATPERIMVEYLSPNTNKPLHLGHVRNGVLGSAVTNMLRLAGHTVIAADLINDRGIHICKSMLGYELFADGATPASSGKKGDHFVGDWYVRFERESKQDLTLLPRAEEMLKKWEENDPETRALWSTMNSWVYGGFAETERRFGFSFDKVYLESELYQLGKDLVADGLARDIFTRDDDGAVVFPLPERFGKSKEGIERTAKVLNPNGTSGYLTQDIGTAVRKAQEYGLDRSLYVVASEQDNHFKALFEILSALGFPWASKCFHLSYAMVELPDGKMKSREGTVVDADDLLDEMAALAAAAIQARDPGVDVAEARQRAEVIALSAIKFYLLSYRAKSTITFDPKQSLAFEGDTGPYCLYAYARIQSILAKAEAAGLSVGEFSAEDASGLGSEQERALALELLMFPTSLVRATESYSPSLLAERVLNVAKAFNRLYRTHPIIGDDRQLSAARLALARATANTLGQGLALLGIRTIERM